MLAKTRSGKTSVRVQEELDWMLAIFKREGVRSYLEIGCLCGDNLWNVARSLPAGSRVVGVDLPTVIPGFLDSEKHLSRCVSDLRFLGYDSHLVIGDSHLPEVVEQVRSLAPFDAIMIDGDHTLAGVTQDWENYGPMSGLVIFDDTGWPAGTSFGNVRIDVRSLWETLRPQYRTEEIEVNASRFGMGGLYKKAD